MPRLEAQKIVSDINSITGTPCRLEDHIKREHVLELPASHIHQVVDLLIHRYETIHLSTITADIEKEDPDNILVLYHFWKKEGYTLLVRLDRKKPEIDSIVDLIPGADFYEREAAEMFGVTFTGRESTPPLLLPDDFDREPPMLINEED